MATRNSRDVELVIRAKNAASKEIESVADSLKTLIDRQDKAGTSASKTGTLFDRLSADLAKLQAEAKGLSALGNVAAQIDKAAAAVDRLKTEADRAVTDLASLKQQQSEVAANSARFAGELNNATAALKKQQTATAAAKTEQTAANRAARDAESAISRLETRIRGMKQPTADLVTGLEAQKVALTGIKDRQQAATIAYTQQKAALESASKALSTVKEQAAAAATVERTLEAAVVKAANSAERQAGAFKTAESTLAGMQAVAAEAATSLGLVGTAQNTLATASERTAIAIGQVTAALSRQQRDRTVTPALQGSALVSAQQAAQRENVVQAGQAFEAARDQAQRLAAALRQAGGSNEELARSFAVAQAAAVKAKDALIQATNAASGQGSFANFDNRITASQRFVQAKHDEGVAAQQAAQVEAAAARQAAEAAHQAQAADTARTIASVRLALTGRQTAAVEAQLAAATRAEGEASGEAASRINGLRGAFASLYGESRQALSLFQRIRGELLGLAAGFVGLYAAIQNIGGVVTAIKTIEAAQNRLGAVFNQNTAKTTQEMRFLQAQANRLGIEFGVLSNEYAKFSIAANAANFQQDTTREIFLKVAEAARVQKLSIEDTQGVFLALTQIMSKGKFQSEEVRRQLGDRLPGAFNFLATALGKTTAQLDKAMSQGEIFATQDNLLKFVNVLSDKFGSQLPTALQTVTTELGRFQNNLFTAQNQVAQGGFADALRDSLKQINAYFRSSDGVAFFSALGAAMGKALTIITGLLNHINELTLAFKAFIAIKAAQAFILIGTNIETSITKALTAKGAFTSFGQVMTALRGQFSLFTGAVAQADAALITIDTNIVATGFAATRSGIALGFFRSAFLGIANAVKIAFTALGGWIGIAVTIASIALTTIFTDWATAVDDSSAALNEHERIMTAVNETYANTAGVINDAGRALKNVSLSDANKNFIDLTKGAAKALADFNKVNAQAANGRAVGAANPEIESIKNLVRQAQTGTIKMDVFVSKLNDLSTSLKSTDAAEFASQMHDLAVKFVDVIGKTAEAGKVAKGLNSSLEGTAQAAVVADKLLAQLNDTTGAQAEAAKAAADAEALFLTAIESLRDQFPELKKQADDAKKVIDGITAAYNAFKAALDTKSINDLALIFASLGTGGPLAFMKALADVGHGDFSKLGTVFQTLGSGLQSLVKGGTGVTGAIDLSAAKGSLDAATTLIKKFEGAPFLQSKFQDTAQRVGFSSDTVTLEDGVARKVTAGLTITLEDANRDLARRISESLLRIQGDIGADKFAALTDAQKAVLASLEYNFGRLPETVAGAIRNGKSDTEVAAAIRALGQTPNAIANNLTGRRNQEADTFAGNAQASLDKELAVQKETADEAERKAKAQQEALAAVEKSIQEGTFEVSQLQESARQAAINKAVHEQEVKLQEQGLALTEQQRTAVAANAAAIFDAANKDKQASEEKKAIEERVNQLYELRKQLQENITFAQQQGNTSQAEVLKKQLTDTDAKLKEAITDATAFYSKMGGPDADLANQKLEGIKNSLVEVKQAFLDAKAVNDILVSSLTDAFTSSAQAIAQVIDGTISLKDGLQAVGQAFLKFAADFLLQLGQMIIKQALFNAIAGGGAGTGGVGGFLSSLFHRGGIVGPGAPKSGRRLSAAAFANAPRFHGGGMPGLAPNEFTAILKKNEEVLTENDPRNALNGGLAAAAGHGGGGDVKIVNTFDAASFLSEALSSRVGEKAIINFVRSNPAVFKQAMNG